MLVCVCAVAQLKALEQFANAHCSFELGQQQVALHAIMILPAIIIEKNGLIR